MFKYLLVVSIVAVGCLNAEVRDPRVILGLSVTTTTKWLATTATCTTGTSCAVLVNATSQCRRRRGIEEKPIVLSLDEETPSPSEPLQLETTQLATDESSSLPELESSTGDIQYTPPLDSQRAITLSLTSFAISISPISALTLLKTSTVTSGVSCQQVITFTTKYTVYGCSPSAIVTC